MPKYIRGLYRTLFIIQQEQPLCSRESIMQKQHPQCLGGYILGTPEGSTHYWWLTRWLEDRSSTTPIWSPTINDTNYRKIQYTQSETLRIATDFDKMSSIDHHLHTEMLKVREHSELLSAQYLVRCLEPENVCHSITRSTPKKQMKDTLYIRHRNTVEPMMVTKNRTLVQLRSGYCGLMGSYKNRIKKDASHNVCAECGMTPHDVKYLFVCPARTTPMTLSDLWSRPADAVLELSYLEARDPDWNKNGLKGEQQHYI